MTGDRGLEALRRGRCLLVSTDTVYGLAALPGSPGYEQIFALNRRRREFFQHRLAPLPDAAIQHGHFQIFALGEVIQRCAVAHHAGGVHGDLVRVFHKRRQGPAGSDGKVSALRHEPLQSFPVLR